MAPMIISVMLILQNKRRLITLGVAEGGGGSNTASCNICNGFGEFTLQL